MRKTIKISIEGADPHELMQINEIIANALVERYHRNTAVFHAGHVSEQAMELIPSSVNLFVLSNP